MIGIGLNIANRVMGGGGGGAPAFDVDAQAFFDRVTAAGGTLSTTEKNATNQLVLDMKTAGIWSSMKAIYPMVGASAAACAQNLKSSSFTGTFTSGWTFASTGVTGNGVSTAMDTGLNTLSELTETSTSIGVYVRNNVVNGDNFDLANSSSIGGGTLPTYLATRYVGNVVYMGIADVTYGTNTSSTDSRGFWTGATNGSRFQTLYKNGTSIRTGTGSGNFANLTLYVGAMNGAGIVRYPTTKEYAFAFIGTGLNGTQAGNYYTAVQAFQTTLSRAIAP
jgi:hypothetical protein